jgi:hypothetical protein
MNPLVSCPGCRAVLLKDVFNRPELTPCPSCGVPLRVEVFPALFRKINPGESAQTIIVADESSCFYHPQKKAVRPCDGCGRFLCALCDCELHEQHFCPACLEAGKSKGKIKSLDNQRTLYDSIALSLAIYPLLIFYLSIVTAPMALFIAIRYWKAPQSILRRTKIRFVAAIILATLQIAGWATLFIALSTRHRS